MSSDSGPPQQENSSPLHSHRWERSGAEAPGGVIPSQQRNCAASWQAFGGGVSTGKVGGCGEEYESVQRIPGDSHCSGMS